MSPIEQLLVACGFCGLLAGLIHIMRRSKTRFLHWKTERTAPAAELRVLARRALTPQHALCLISLEKRVLLVGTYAGGMQILPLSRRAAGRDRRSASRGKRQSDSVPVTTCKFRAR